MIISPSVFGLLICAGLFQFCWCNAFPSLNHIKPQAAAKVQENAVRDLILRVIPERARDFEVAIEPNTDDAQKDNFQIWKLSNGTVRITGTSGVSAATGFQYYLKYFCKCHISWEESQLQLPEDLPEVNVSINLNDKFRYYQNVCTTSYSFVWWDWKQWEKHIDWMALNGFNLVLAFNGQEAIWERVYRKFNLTQTEIDEHFTGPAFLSWLRMGNIRGWAGPLSTSWHLRSVKLQKQILERMRSLGIIPVLPAFAGHVPDAFRRLYPNATMTKMEPWNSFNETYCCPYFLDPREDLFNEIGRSFMEELISEFGTDHVYNCDSFNENKPATTDLVYLKDVGRSIFKAMTDTDPLAIWMLQGWMFSSDMYWTDRHRVEAFLTSVPLGRMIVLDLQSEQFPQYQRLDQYFGQPYVWCMLHDFGGTLGMFGSSSIINERPFEARSTENSTMIGTGLTPEGINQNYAIYDLMTETAWRSSPSQLPEWFQNYTIRRYGAENPNATNAWKILQRTVYDFSGIEKMRGQYAITRTPSLKISVWSWYSADDLHEAWTSLLNAANFLGSSPAYRHDLVDVTRQVLQVNGDLYYTQMIAAFREKHLKEFQGKAHTFLQIFYDLEEILSTNEHFLLGPWLESAKACADNEEDRNLFEYNARNQITLWGPNGEIMNYANKQWAGVVSTFFGPRWRLFINYMNETLINDSGFNSTYIKNKMFKEVEEPFTFDKREFPTEPTGDSVDVARKLHEKWLDMHLRRTRSSQENSLEDSSEDHPAKRPRVVLV